MGASRIAYLASLLGLAALLAAPVLQAGSPAPDARLAQAEAAFESARIECEFVADVDWKARTLMAIAYAQAKAGDLAAGRQTFLRARQAALSIKNDSRKPRQAI